MKEKFFNRYSTLFTLTFLALFAVIFATLASPTLALGDCAGTAAAANIASLSATSDGVVTASGTWSVSGGANGAYIRFYLDGSLIQSESKSGTSGSWNFTDDGLSLGSHTLMVRVYVKADGTICWNHYDTDSEPFTVVTPPYVSLLCTELSYPIFQCTGSVTGGGTAPYTPWWNVTPGSWYQSGSSGSGPWTQQYICRNNPTVSFKVQDASGTWSNTDFTICNGPGDWFTETGSHERELVWPRMVSR